MAALDIMVEETAEKAGVSSQVVRSALAKGISFVPEGVKLTKDNLRPALTATRALGSSVTPEEHRVLDTLDRELDTMGKLKSLAVFAVINSSIGSLRAELQK